MATMVMLSSTIDAAACNNNNDDDSVLQPNNNNNNNNNHRKRGLENSVATSSSRFKGVFMQQNGRWGAQIYANHSRVWLGTFKTEVEAAIAYDSAAIKLKPRSGGGDTSSCRNIPLTNLTIHEPNFQSLYSSESILNMLKQGSYYSKLMDFIRYQPQQMEQRSKGGTAGDADGEVVYHQLLFQKELTPSDVGKLNRLVIPKKYALQYFPDQVIGKVEDDLELSFFDRQMRQWNFRYCYWESSQSCVFTRGWHRFVKAMNLKSNDVVKFYKCQHHRGNVFYMIDVEYWHNNVAENKSVSWGSTTSCNVELRLGTACSSSSKDAIQSENEVMSLGQQNLAKKRKLVRLFGVDISSSE